RLHRHLEEGLEQWRVCRGLSQVPRQDRLADAVHSDAELLFYRRGKFALRSADTVQHLTPSNSSNEPAGLALIAPASRPSPSLLLRIPILAELFYLGHDCAVIWHGLKSLAPAEILPDDIEPEPRWLAFDAVLAVGGLYTGLPDALTMGPRWLVPSAVLALLIPTVVFHHTGRQRLNNLFGFAVDAALTLELMVSIALLIAALPTHKESPQELLLSASSLWITNI